MNWKELQQWLFEEDERERAGLSLFTVEITQQHIDLLRFYWVHWHWTNQPEAYFCGIPNVTLYRPYGNSDVVGDIARIMGITEPDWDAGATWSEDQLKAIAKLHRGAGYAMEVMLQLGQLAPGKYTTLFRHGWQPEKKG